MSVARPLDDSSIRVLIVAAFFATTLGHAADDDDALPDAEFLDYLGSWEESDADWLALAEEPPGNELDDKAVGGDAGMPAEDGDTDDDES